MKLPLNSLHNLACTCELCSKFLKHYVVRKALSGLCVSGQHLVNSNSVPVQQDIRAYGFEDKGYLAKSYCCIACDTWIIVRSIPAGRLTLEQRFLRNRDVGQRRAIAKSIEHEKAYLAISEKTQYFDVDTTPAPARLVLH